MFKYFYEPFELDGPDGHLWNSIVAGLPNSHVLQTAEWSLIKSKFGWQRLAYLWKDSSQSIQAAAMLLARSVSIPFLPRFFRLIYIPRGPLLDWTDPELREQVLLDLEKISRDLEAVFVKMDPDVRLGTGRLDNQQPARDTNGYAVVEDLRRLGWRYSEEQVQFKNTVLLDLTAGKDDLQSAMKQKTRYNIRLASRKGVTIREGGIMDIPLLYQLYLETSVRDNFVIREQAYYQQLWSTFMSAGMAQAYIAEVNGKAVAGLIVFKFASKAWFLFGMSGSNDREKMPNYLLQWEAITRLKANGCKVYDLWGAPDEFADTDPLWGVYRFKEGLGGITVRHIGAWDLPLSQVKYNLYSRVLPTLLDWMRWRGKASARRMLS